MTAFLKAADLTQDAFLKLIGNLTPSSDTFPCHIYLEAADGWALDWWDWKSNLGGEISWYTASQELSKDASRACLKKSTSGRLFALEGELRWRTITALGDSCWRVIFLGNVDWVGTALEDYSDSLNNLHPQKDSFYLWGQRTQTAPDDWIELRIPHRFQYPIHGKPQRLKVVTEQWSDDTGEPHFVRLCHLESI